MASLTAVSCLFFQAAVLQFLLVAEASHFRYGTISWAPVDSYSNTLRFTFRLAFRRSFSSSYYCDQSTIGSGSIRGSGGSWRAKCNYCSPTTIASTGFHCTDYSSNEDWTVGENNFNYTFSSYDRWVVSYSSCCWISLSRYGNGAWFISTTVNLTRRSDNGRINSSPVSRSPAIVRWSEGCPSQSIRIPVEDADGDVVKCRYANYSESYFNNDSFPYGTFDEKTCLLTYNGNYGTAGTYAVALTIEDFPAGTTNFDSITPFSAVGLQFLVIISSHSGSCNNVPVFTPSTPNDGECTEVQTGSLYRVVIEATLKDYSKSVVEIVTSSPPGMQFTSLRFHGGVYYRNVTWYPNQYQVGQQSFCFKAVDSSGMGTEWRCVTILVGISSTPRVVWGSQTPQSPSSNSGPGYVWWSIQFDRVIKKPRTSSYIRLVLLPSGHTVHKVDTISQFVKISSTTLQFAMPYAALSMNGSYAILMDRGAVVGQGCSYDGPPTPGITNTSDWEFTAGVCPVGYTLAPPDFSNCVDINECGSPSRSKRSFHWWGYTTSSSTQWLTTAISPSTSSSYVPFTASFPGSCSSHIYNYYGSSGNLYSPGYPGCYTNNLMCTWLIEAPFGYHVYLYFYHFSLEYGGSYCPYDFLEIRDGNTLSSPLITKACGSLGYFYMYSSGRFLLLRFRTDGRVQGAGFAGYYRTYSYRGSNWIPSNQVSSTSFVACVPSQTLVTRISTTLPIIPTTSSSYIPSTLSYSEILGLNNSVIVGNNSEYLANLTNWIKPRRSESDWKLCWRASRDGWDNSRFHSLCDGKGPTVTIVKVGKYIFGGYTSLSWGYGCSYQYDPQAFLFSLVNLPGWAPVKLNQTGRYGYYQSHSIYTCYSSGPTFGGGHDLRVYSYHRYNLYYTNLGYTYSPPSGYSYGNSFARSFLAGSYYFNPDEIETFYDTTFTSQAATRTISPSYTASSIASPSLSPSVSASQSVLPSTSPSVSASLPVSTECSNHTYLEDYRRAQGFYNGPSGYYRCDNNLPFGWYRFRGPAGTQMASTCIGVNRCGSHGPGWLSTQHPFVSDGIVNGTACFHWGGSCCLWSINVRVRNCSGFYVYELRPTTSCHYRYCGDGEAASSSLSSSTSVRASQITPSSSSGYYAPSSSYALPAPVDFQFHVPSDCDQICTNTPGSYRCSCVRGYQLSSDEKSCVDIDECSTNNGGCSHHCYNIPGSFYCGCPEGTTMASNNLTCVEPGVSVACDENNMTVSLEKQTFPYFNVSSLHLRYSSCRATENSTHFLISTPLNSCGTLVNETEDALIFWNEIRADAVIIDNVITRTHDIKFKFYCSYSRRKMLSIQFQPQHIFIGSEAGYGNFTFKMDFYKTAAFATPYTENDYPILVALNEYLYVKYSVESSASNQLVIMAENCKATRYGSFYSWPYYNIIQNGCEQDTTMDYTYDPLTSSQKLKIRSFRFFNDYDVVYFHCELLACYKGNSNSRCSRGCLSSKRRKRRGAVDDEIEHEESTSKHILSSGPIMIKETETETEERDEGDTGKSQQTALIGGAAAAGGLSLIVVIALAVLAVKYRIARRFMNRNKVGDLYTTQDEQMSRRNAYIQEDDMIEREDSF